MEFLSVVAWGLVAVAVLGVPLVLPIVALVISVRRTGVDSSLSRRIQNLENEIQKLRADLARIRQDASSTADAPKTAPSVSAPAEPPAPMIFPREPLAVPAPPLTEPPVNAVPSSKSEEAANVAMASAGVTQTAAPDTPTEAVSTVDWERWLGVRGAAVLGSGVLGLAGLFFFKYSIDHGLISPMLRVILGTLAGIGCIGWSQQVQRRYTVTSNALAGAGIILLYAAFWAARTLYNLVPLELAFGLMGATTFVCCMLSVRHQSLVIAVLGLVGGFATPLLLASDANQPFGLFSYVLVLDAGFLYIAYKRRWAVVALLALVATTLLQTLWFFTRMTPEQMALSLGIFGVFAMVFAFTARKTDPTENTLWSSARMGGVLIPYAFAFSLAQQAEFGPRFYPIAILLGLLAAAASWIERRTQPKASWLSTGAAAATVAVMASWLLSRVFVTSGIAWEAACCAVALNLVFHVFREIDRGTSRTKGAIAAALIANFGSFACLLVAATQAVDVPFWPWLSGWIGLTALLYRQAMITDEPKLQMWGALAFSGALGIVYTWHHSNSNFPRFSLFMAIVMLLGALLFAPGLSKFHERWAWYASALAAPVWFLPLKEAYETWLGQSTIGALPLGLATLPLLGALRSRAVWPENAALRKTALAWYGASALGLISIAVPLQLEREWITIGWALEALAVTALWKRLDHAGLKWLAMMLFAVVTVRLVLNIEVLDYHARGPYPIVNWLLYTYWVPVFSMLGAYVLLASAETSRVRDWERFLYTQGHATMAAAIAMAAIVLIFVWINLAIYDWFATGPLLTINFERQPAKDLTTSFAWALYAAILLAIGMSRKSRALRWVSLVFFIVTIGKVGIYDLGELEDLYRVMSLLGLALALIGVSLAYQRFVFRKSVDTL